MTQVNSSPGVPNTLASVVYSSATPILTGPTLGAVGSGAITTLASITTETANIWPAVLLAQATTSAYFSSTPIVLDPAVFKGAPFGVQV